MTMEIYYFTGTGNCLHVARAVADKTGGRAIPIPEVIGDAVIRIDADRVGVVFPAYLAALYGVPLIVERFIGQIEDIESKELFAICTCGGYEIVNAVPTLRNLARFTRGLGARLRAEYTVRLPMNNLDYEHIPVPIVTDEETILRKADRQIADISGRIMGCRSGRHHLARRLFTTAMRPMYSRMRESCMRSLRELAGEPADSALGFRELMPRTDASIRVDESCTGCGVCARVCPVGNIELVDDRPVRRHHCEMCFACDEWCPRGAVHHWGRPDGAKYHYPGVKARDLYKEPSPR